MKKGYVLYNPKAGGGEYVGRIHELDMLLEDPLVYMDITQIQNYGEFMRQVAPEDYLILCGGDGTLNRFINDTEGLSIANEILYYPIGSGNDFAHDAGKSKGDKPFRITEYLKDLPWVEVNGKRYRFLNGVGYGIDGYCCEVGDKLRESSNKSPNYTAIAVKGLLFHYKPTGATVTVDGEKRTYRKVWLVPTMNGRFYGGGMMPTPNQDRGSGEKTLSAMVFHGAGKLKTLMVFPSIFKGEHIAHKDMVDILTGHEITVEFDRPTALQIDGETILGVTSYKAISAVKAESRQAAGVI